LWKYELEIPVFIFLYTLNSNLSLLMRRRVASTISPSSLVEKGLTSIMVMHDLLSKRIAPLQQCARPAWLYTGENDTTRLERSRGSILDPDVLETMLL
jgi:hypothetical protein